MSETKSTLLQYRDQLFLLDLYNTQFLDVEYLQENIYRDVSKTTIHRRMRKLEEEGYIQSFRVPILETRGGQSKYVFALGKLGAEEIRALKGEVDWRYDIATRTPSHVYHQLLLSHVYAAYMEDRLVPKEERVPKNEKYELIQYINEKSGYFAFDGSKDGNDKASKFTIRPDGGLVLQNKKTGKNAAFFIEIERSQQSRETTVKKLQRYNLYCQQQLYREEHLAYDVPVETPRILFISNNPRGIKRLLNHSKGVDTSSTAGVLFASLEDVLNAPYGNIFVAKDSMDPETKYSIASPLK